MVNKNNELKLLEEFEGRYGVTNDGRIWSYVKNRWLRPDEANGYMRVDLTPPKGKKRKYLVHRLVALAFIPNPENKRFINHKDGNKTNNNVDNLEWVTSSENQIHAYRTLGREPIVGEKCNLTKITDTIINEIKEELNSGKSTTEIAKKYNITRTYAWMIKKDLWRKNVTKQK